MTRKTRRLALIGTVLSVLGVATGLILWGLSGNITFFNSPTDLLERPVALGQRIRVGGLVAAGSVVREPDQNVRFTVTDGRNDLEVRFRGILPDLFREGQGIVAEGSLAEPRRFLATTVLAKHDETYMPREVADALRRQGHFREGESVPAMPAEGAPPRAPTGGGGS